MVLLSVSSSMIFILRIYIYYTSIEYHNGMINAEMITNNERRITYLSTGGDYLIPYFLEKEKNRVGTIIRKTDFESVWKVANQ